MRRGIAAFQHAQVQFQRADNLHVADQHHAETQVCDLAEQIGIRR